MRAYHAFLKKELIESVRTYKLVIMLSVFAFLGILNVVAAKFLPALMENLLTEGIQITLPEPSAVDAWTQFYKNVTQMGFILLVILFSGMFAREFSQGTLTNMLTKGLSRNTVLLSKFSASALIWSASYWLSFAVTYIYTLVYWDETGVLSTLALSAVGPWLFGLLLLATLKLGGILTKTSAGSMLVVAALVVLLFVINIIPAMQAYSPVWLVSHNMEMVAGGVSVSKSFLPSAVCLALTALFLLGAAALFRKRQIV